MSILENLPHRCEIYRRSVEPNSDDLGVVVDRLVLVAANVSCFEQPVNTTESKDWQKRGITVTSKIYFVADPQIDERHVIFLTNRNGTSIPANSRIRLEVRSISEPDASMGASLVWRAMLENKRSSI